MFTTKMEYYNKRLFLKLGCIKYKGSYTLTPILQCLLQKWNITTKDYFKLGCIKYKGSYTLTPIRKKNLTNIP